MVWIPLSYHIVFSDVFGMVVKYVQITIDGIPWVYHITPWSRSQLHKGLWLSFTWQTLWFSTWPLEANFNINHHQKPLQPAGTSKSSSRKFFTTPNRFWQTEAMLSAWRCRQISWAWKFGVYFQTNPWLAGFKMLGSPWIPNLKISISESCVKITDFILPKRDGQNLGQNAWYHIWSLNIHKSYRFCDLLGSYQVAPCIGSPVQKLQPHAIEPQMSGQKNKRGRFGAVKKWIRSVASSREVRPSKDKWYAPLSDCLKCWLPDKVYRWESLCPLLLIRWWWKHQSWCRTNWSGCTSSRINLIISPLYLIASHDITMFVA